MGRPAIRAAIVVIMIGRKRTTQAETMASVGDRPWSRWAAMAKSIIMMPFFLTMPTSMMMPTKA